MNALDSIWMKSVFPDIFAILLILFEFIRVIRGLTHYLGLMQNLGLYFYLC